VADWTEADDYGLNVVTPAWTGGFIPPLFTDFTYDNLGVPKNPEIADLTGNEAEDVGLAAGALDGNTEAYGLFQVMTIRNIGLTSPYAHNGLFKTLKEITHFYNTRDVAGSLPKGESWQPPEVSGYPVGCNCDPGIEDVNAPDYCEQGVDFPCVFYTVNHGELGSLGLSDDDEDAIVEFMKTLNDGWSP
jgi:cytochrome c peroxidase